jgi:catechol 2,3-dioxygenase-like lactoylglutathione lyase family enzyme
LAAQAAGNGAILDHMGFGVSDYERAKTFYAHALAPLGLALLMEIGPEHNETGWAAGFGRDGALAFWIGSEGRTAPRLHVAFTAASRDAVRAFHAAALAAGGADHGGPGLRPHDHPDYFAAFVLDPDGHNIEAVCHLAEAEA